MNPALEELAAVDPDIADTLAVSSLAAPKPIAKRTQARIKGEDLARRGLSWYTTPAGTPKEIVDPTTSAPLTGFDKRHQVAWDSAGAPKKISYDPTTGAPSLADAYDVPDFTDTKTGDVYKAPPGLPWKQVGEDAAIKDRLRRKREETLNRETAAALAPVRAEAAARYRDSVHAVKESAKATVAEFGALGVPLLNDDGSAPIDLTASDAPALRAHIEQVYNREYGSDAANAKPLFGGGRLSHEAETLRADIDRRKQRAFELADAHSATVAQAGAARSQLDNIETQRKALVGDRLADVNDRRAASGMTRISIPGLDSTTQDLQESVATSAETGGPAAEMNGGQPEAVAPFAPGEAPFRFHADGTASFDPARLEDGLKDAFKVGMIDEPTFKTLLPKAQAAQKAFIEQQKLLANDTVASKLKALGYGATKAGAFLAGAPPGAAAGASIGAFGGPFDPITVPLGAAVGGLITGGAASFAADRILRKLGEYSDTIKSFTEAADVHPHYDQAGNLLAFAAGVPKTIAGLAGDAALRSASGASAGTIATALTTRVAQSAATNVAIDTIIKEGARGLGLSDDGQTLDGAAQAALIGAFVSGHGITFRDFSPGEVGTLLIKAREATARGIDPKTILTPSEFEAATAAAAEIQRVKTTGSAPENPLVSVRQAQAGGKNYGVSAGKVEGSAPSGEPAPASNQIPQLPLQPNEDPQQTVPAGQTPQQLSPETSALAPGESPQQSSEASSYPVSTPFAPTGQAPKDEQPAEVAPEIELVAREKEFASMQDGDPFKPLIQGRINDLRALIEQQAGATVAPTESAATALAPQGTGSAGPALAVPKDSQTDASSGENALSIPGVQSSTTSPETGGATTRGSAGEPAAASARDLVETKGPSQIATPERTPAEAAKVPSIAADPHDYVPAIKVGGETVSGQPGDAHRDVLARYMAERESREPGFGDSEVGANAVLDFDAPGNRNFFLKHGTEPVSREQLKTALGVSDAQGLSRLQKEQPRQPRAAAAAPSAPPNTPYTPRPSADAGTLSGSSDQSTDSGRDPQSRQKSASPESPSQSKSSSDQPNTEAPSKRAETSDNPTPNEPAISAEASPEAPPEHPGEPPATSGGSSVGRRKGQSRVGTGEIHAELGGSTDLPSEEHRERGTRLAGGAFRFHNEGIARLEAAGVSFQKKRLPSASSGIAISKETLEVLYDAGLLGRYAEQIDTNGLNGQTWVRATVAEEIIHAADIIVTTLKQRSGETPAETFERVHAAIHAALGPEADAAMAKVYKASRKPADVAAEYLRMYVQHERGELLTEATFGRDMRPILKFLERAQPPIVRTHYELMETITAGTGERLPEVPDEAPQQEPASPPSPAEPTREKTDSPEALAPSGERPRLGDTADAVWSRWKEIANDPSQRGNSETIIAKSLDGEFFFGPGGELRKAVHLKGINGWEPTTKQQELELRNDISRGTVQIERQQLKGMDTTLFKRVGAGQTNKVLHQATGFPLEKSAGETPELQSEESFTPEQNARHEVVMRKLTSASSDAPQHLAEWVKKNTRWPKSGVRLRGASESKGLMAIITPVSKSNVPYQVTFFDTGKSGIMEPFGDVPVDTLEDGIFQANLRNFTDASPQKGYFPTHENEVSGKPGAGRKSETVEDERSGAIPGGTQPASGARTAEKLAHSEARDLGKVIAVPKGTAMVRAVDDMGREAIIPVAELKGANVLQGGGPFRRLEAGTLDAKKRFLPIGTPITVRLVEKPQALHADAPRARALKLIATKRALRPEEQAELDRLSEAAPEPARQPSPLGRSARANIANAWKGAASMEESEAGDDYNGWVEAKQEIMHSILVPIGWAREDESYHTKWGTAYIYLRNSRTEETLKIRVGDHPASRERASENTYSYQVPKKATLFQWAAVADEIEADLAALADENETAAPLNGGGGREPLIERIQGKANDSQPALRATSITDKGVGEVNPESLAPWEGAQGLAKTLKTRGDTNEPDTRTNRRNHTPPIDPRSIKRAGGADSQLPRPKSATPGAKIKPGTTAQDGGDPAGARARQVAEKEDDRPLSADAPDADGDGKRKRSQVFGQEEIGHEYDVRHRARARAIMKGEFFDADGPVTPERTEELWNLIYDWSDRFEGPKLGQRVVQSAGKDGDLAPGLLKIEMMRYAIKTGDQFLKTSLERAQNLFYPSASKAGAELSGLSDFHEPSIRGRKAVADERDKLIQKLVGGEATLEKLREAVNRLKVSEAEKAALLEKLAEIEAQLAAKADFAPPTPKQLDVLLEALIRQAMAAGADKLKITPYRTDIESRIMAQFPQMGMRAQLNEQGGRKIAGAWWKLLAGPGENRKGHLATADDALNAQLGGILKEALEKMGLVAKGEAAKITDAEKLAMVLGKGELRAGKLAEADKLVREAIDAQREAALAAEDADADAIEVHFEQLRGQWEEASKALQDEPASARLFRKMTRSELGELGHDWKTHFDEGRDTAKLRASVVEKIAHDVQAAATNPLDLATVIRELGKAFDTVAAEQENRWKLNRARRRPAKDVPNATATSIIDRFQNAQTEWLKPDAKKNVVREIVNAALQGEVNYHADEPANFTGPLTASLEAAGVTPDKARLLAREIWQERANAQSRAIVAEMDRIANGTAGLRPLVDAILGAPLHQRLDPAWRRQAELDYLTSHGLTAELAAGAQRRFDAELTATWLKAETQAAAKVVGLKPESVAAVQKAIRARLTDPSRDWETILARENGWKGFSAAQDRRMGEIDAIISDESVNPYQRAKAISELSAIIRHAKLPASVWHVIAEAFNASALAGLPTATVQLSPILANVRDLMTAALTDPRTFATALKSFKTALANFKPEFKWAWQNDTFTYHVNDYIQQSGALKDLMESGLADIRAGRHAKGVAKVLYGSQTFVFRFLSAMDQASRTMTREWKTAMYGMDSLRTSGYSPAEIDRLVDSVAAIKQRAYEDGRADGLSEEDARVQSHAVVVDAWHEAITEKAGAEVAGQVDKAARYDAKLMLGIRADKLTEDDEGMLSRLGMNWFMKSVTEAMGSESAATRIGARLMFGFVNVPFRTLRFFAGYSPYGLLRYAVHNQRTKAHKDTYWKQSYATNQQTRQRLREAIVGTALMVLAGALVNRSSDDRDEKKGGLFVTGQGPDSTDKALRDAWLKKFKPYSLTLKIGGTYATLPLSRVGEAILWPMALAGAIDDYHWRKKHEAGKKTPKDLSEIAEVAGAYFYSMGQRGIFQSFSRLGDLASPRSGNPLERAAGAAGYSLSPLLPWNSFTQSFTRMLMDPPDKSSLAAAVFANTPVAWVSGKPALNTFGDPLGDRTLSGKAYREGLPISLNLGSAPGPVYRLILDKGQAPPTPVRKVVEKSYGALSDEQWYQFSLARGQRLKSMIAGSAARLSAMNGEDFNEALNQFALSATKAAGAAVGLRPLAKPVSVAARKPSPDSAAFATTPPVRKLLPDFTAG